ncbi:AAC(3)-I family aminoglycoside N-acetyltransferase [Rubrivivax sp. RP6-9]|uniref:AAC(3)-I family aminoglycoside N-acetyltransferase n=1 Tax=Rubrivivax sp. RP6-9 TaxID=3415750 RepID=UPI003CC61F2D
MEPSLRTQVLAPTDVSLLRGMLKMFGDAFQDPESYSHKPPSEAYLSKLLASETFLAVATIYHGQVVGGLAGYILPKFEQERSEFYIYDLAVAESFRRQGVATALFQCLQGVAAERGIYVIFVQADYGDDPAVELYTKLGTREDVMHFDIPPANGAA